MSQSRARFIQCFPRWIISTGSSRALLSSPGQDPGRGSKDPLFKDPPGASSSARLLHLMLANLPRLVILPSIRVPDCLFESLPRTRDSVFLFESLPRTRDSEFLFESLPRTRDTCSLLLLPTLLSILLGFLAKASPGSRFPNL